MDQDERQKRDIEIAKLTAISHLKLVPRDQPLGAPLFEAIARLSVGVAVEAVLFRETDGRLEVYLTKRAATESAYANEWHCPGSFMRPGESYDDVLERLSQKEFKAEVERIRLVGIVNHLHEERGHVQSHICLVAAEGEPQAENSGWFALDGLPDGTVDCHVNPIIPMAAAAYKEPILAVPLIER